MSSKPAPATLSDIGPLGDGILCDILLPPPPGELEAELESRHRAGYSYVSLTMAADREASPASVYAHLAKMRYELSRQSDKYSVVDSVDDIRVAKKSEKLGIGFHFQGTEAVGRDLANVGAYYKLGVRWMLMAYNYQNNVGTGRIEAQKRDLGLSEFGRDLIAEMNRVGMLVDCSHSGYRTTMDAMAASSKPCIFSHSNPRALHDHPRNIWDDQIKACAQTGGIIGVNGVGPFMGEPHEVSADAMLRQIDYLVDLVGPKHVALGPRLHDAATLQNSRRPLQRRPRRKLRCRPNFPGASLIPPTRRCFWASSWSVDTKPTSFAVLWAKTSSVWPPKCGSRRYSRSRSLL